jgi:hypothetical protein
MKSASQKKLNEVWFGLAVKQAAFLFPPTNKDMRDGMAFVSGAGGSKLSPRCSLWHSGFPAGA